MTISGREKIANQRPTKITNFGSTKKANLVSETVFRPNSNKHKLKCHTEMQEDPILGEIKLPV